MWPVRELHLSSFILFLLFEPADAVCMSIGVMSLDLFSLARPSRFFSLPFRAPGLAQYRS